MSDELRVSWRRGEKVALAARCKITPQHLSDLLCGRKRAKPETAESIEEVARAMGLHLSRNDVMYPHDSTNPLMNTKAARA